MYGSWNDYLLTGVEQIDEQHKKLVSMLDSLMTAMRSGACADEVKRSIEFLGNYVSEHFATEERYMNDSTNVNWRIHRDRHDEFTAMVNEFAREAENCGPSESLAMKIKSELLEWLIDHIGGEDKRLGAL